MRTPEDNVNSFYSYCINMEDDTDGNELKLCFSLLGKRKGEVFKN